MVQPKLFETDMSRGAGFSPCRTWRYALWRTWGEATPSKSIAFCGLNPSTADERLDDPTITRCIRYALGWGYEHFVMLNAFGFRSTDPRGLKKTDDPVGPGNDAAIAYYATQVDCVVVAWGIHCPRERAESVLKLVGPKAFCLGKNMDGTPKHPLYLRKSAERIPYGIGDVFGGTTGPEELQSPTVAETLFGDENVQST